MSRELLGAVDPATGLWGGAQGEMRLLGLGFGHWDVLLLPGMGAQMCSSAP